jgi:hypothetical protein
LFLPDGAHAQLRQLDRALRTHQEASGGRHQHGSFDEVIVTSFIAGKYDTVPKKIFNELLIGLTVLALAAVTVILSRAGKLKQTLV